MEYKALPLPGRANGIELRRVRAEGQKDAVLRNGFLQRHGPRVPAEPALHQAADDLVFGQLAGAVPDVVPHHKLREGEDTQIGGLQHIPALLGHDRLPYHREHLPGINTVFVLGKGLQTANPDAEILAELLQQRDIHLGLVVPEADHIAPVGPSAHQLHRQEDQGRVAGLGAAGRLIPAQQSQGKVESIGAVLLQGGFGGAVQLFNFMSQLALCEDTAQPLVLEFRFHQLPHVPQLVHDLKADGVPGQLPVRGAGQDGEIAAVCQGILQITDGRNQQGHHSGQAHIDQRIAQAQIQQLSLPDLFLCGGNAPLALPHIHPLPHLPGGIRQLPLLHLIPLDLPTGLRLDPERQRRDAAVPGAGHVNHTLDRVVSYQLLLRRPACVVKGHVFPGDKRSALYHHQLVDSVGQSLG